MTSLPPPPGGRPAATRLSSWSVPGSPARTCRSPAAGPGWPAPTPGCSSTWQESLKPVSPGWVLLENVPGLLSSNRGQDFATVLGTLADIGYGVSWRVLDSRYFGVPQRRRRVFLVGRRRAICPFQVLFEPNRGPGNPAPGRPPGPARPRPAAPGAGAAHRHPTGPRPDQPGGVAEVAATLTASLGHHSYRSPRGDGSDTLIVGSPAGGQVAPSLLANRSGQRTTDLNTPMVAVLPPASDRDQPGRAALTRSFAENQRGAVTTAAVASVAAGPSSTVDDGALVATHPHPLLPDSSAEEGVVDGSAGGEPRAGGMVRRLTPANANASKASPTTGPPSAPATAGCRTAPAIGPWATPSPSRSSPGSAPASSPPTTQ